RISEPHTSYGDPARARDTFQRLAADVAHAPGVAHSAVTSYAAMGPGGGSNGLLTEDAGAFDLRKLIQSQLRIITPDFFAAMRIPIVKGRAFTADDRRGGLNVMIVSQTLVARTDGDPQALAPSLRAALARIDPDLPLFDVRQMDQRLTATLATARFNTLLLSLLGVVGLLLAASGIYGVIAYFVSQRTQEIGVRIALGASSGAVVRLVLREAMRPVALGAGVGVAAALGAGRRLSR